MTPRVYQDGAVVLRRYPIGETDRVVVLFARERGKLSAIAKGSRRPLSRLGGGTEPLTQSTVQLAVGQNLDVLTQCRVDRSFPGLRRDLERLGFGSYLLELVESAVAERQPHPELWDLLVSTLALLEEATSAELLVRAFEINALSLLGYEPELERCLICGQAPDAAGAGFHPLRGGMLCARCKGRAPGSVAIAGETLALLRCMRRSPLQRFQQAEVPTGQRAELARCMVPFIRHRLEAPLRSLQFLEEIVHGAAGGG